MSSLDLPHVADEARLAAVAATGLLDTEPEDAFDELASLAAQLLEAPFAFVTLVDSTRSYWKARIGLPAGAPAQNTVEESFCQYVIASGEPLIVGDTSANALTARNPSIEAMGVQAWAGFPLMTPDGLALGSFCVVDTVIRQWSERDVEVLRVLSAAAGREVALRGAGSRAEIANQQLELLARVGRALGDTLDAEEAIARLAHLVVPLLGDWSLIAIADDNHVQRDVGWWHSTQEGQRALERFAGERLKGIETARGATLQALRSREPVIVSTGALEAGLAVLMSPQARHAYQELNPACYGIWPLVSDDTVHGALVIARDAARESFTPAEVGLATDIADRAAIVLRNAALYAQQQHLARDLAGANERLRRAADHDRSVARALQDAMLPIMPTHPDYEVTARYLTADASDQVGGDWYDALLPASGPVTLVIGDVAGHDIAAATVMGQLRNLLRALAWQLTDHTPSMLISRLDRAMRDLGITTMTTLTVVRIDSVGDSVAPARSRKVVWSCAGHFSPLRISGEGVATQLHAPADPPLAVLRDPQRHDYESWLAPGETLLLYTDGLIETRTEDHLVGETRLLTAVNSAHPGDVGEMLDIVLRTTVGSQPQDDVALIALRYEPAPDLA